MPFFCTHLWPGQRALHAAPSTVDWEASWAWHGWQHSPNTQSWHLWHGDSTIQLRDSRWAVQDPQGGRLGVLGEGARNPCWICCSRRFIDCVHDSCAQCCAWGVLSILLCFVTVRFHPVAEVQWLIKRILIIGWCCNGGKHYKKLFGTRMLLVIWHDNKKMFYLKFWVRWYSLNSAKFSWESWNLSTVMYCTDMPPLLMKANFSLEDSES